MDPDIGKLAIVGPIKVGMGGIAVFMERPIMVVPIHVECRGKEDETISTRGSASALAIATV